VKTLMTLADGGACRSYCGRTADGRTVCSRRFARRERARAWRYPDLACTDFVHLMICCTEIVQQSKEWNGGTTDLERTAHGPGKHRCSLARGVRHRARGDDGHRG